MRIPKMNRYYALIFLAIFVSGCTGFPDLFGGNVLDIRVNVNRESPSNVLTIKDAQLIPTSPVLPDQDITFTFTMQNTDDIKEAENVAVDLFNAPSFKDRRGKLCNTDGSDCAPLECSTKNQCSLIAGEEKQIRIDLTAPSESDIAGIRTDTSLNYKVDYDFESALVYTASVVNLDEIIKRQRANEKTIVEYSKSQSSGPLQIDVDLSTNYILSGQSAIISFMIKNTGGGTVKDSQIVASDGQINDETVDKGLIVIFPKELQPVEPYPRDFTCLGDVGSQTTRCFNNGPISLFRDETRTSIRFNLESSLPADVPLRSYVITAYVGYRYEMRDSVKVTVNPFQNVR